MECEQSPLVSRYLDGELSELERLSLETHLGACAMCASTMAAFRALGARASAVAPTADPFARRRALAATLAAGRAPVWRPRGLRFAAVSLVVVLGATVGYLWPRPADVAGEQRAPSRSEIIAKFDRSGRAVIAVVPNRPARRVQP